MRDDTWHMTQNQQMVTLFIALGIVAVIVMGVWTLWEAARDAGSIAVFTDEVVSEPADVVEIEREYPVEMPRRPEVLGPRGWRG